MGGRVARRLLDAGHPVAGYNRTPARAEALVAAGLTLCAVLARLAGMSDA